MTDPASMPTARTDAQDWLIEADEPLAGLQRRAGGDLPGIIVAPALLALVRKARCHGLKLARRIEARDDAEQISAWVEVRPDRAGDGCHIRLSDWQSRPLPDERQRHGGVHHAGIAQDIADLKARLGPGQEVLAVTSHAPDTAALAQEMEAGLGRHWAEFVALEDGRAQGDWRALDRARLRLPESDREWVAHISPLGNAGAAGFDLALVAEDSLPVPDTRPAEGEPPKEEALGPGIAPALRQPVARIIANAETIRSQLAGPLAAEYTGYAGDIASAGEHLLAMIDDLAELDAVEDEGFFAAAEQIDLADLARRAAGILAVRAQQKSIALQTPMDGETVLAVGESRRVLQILLNLLGNAILYSPEESRIHLSAGHAGGKARAMVADEGDGLSEEEQARIFEKFERLSRKGDAGSGLGLYISRRLARAMDGELLVESAKGRGARFILQLPIAAADNS